VELDVRIGSKSHIIKVPEYIADGLRNDTCTNERRGLTWSGVAVTISYGGIGVGPVLTLYFKRRYLVFHFHSGLGLLRLESSLMHGWEGFPLSARELHSISSCV
jgi:hypothetical protein